MIRIMNHVIIGNGVAGISAAFTIREREPEHKITVISPETPYYYSRTALMYIAMNELRLEDTEPFERRTYRDRNIDLVSKKAEKVDPSAKAVILEGGEQIHYDKLLLATGALPRSLGFGEEKLRGILHMVSYDDTMEIIEETPRPKKKHYRAVVIGGGLIGIEMAEVLQRRGAEVTLIIRGNHFFRSEITEEEGRFAEEHLRRHGMDVRTGTEVTEILSRDGRVTGIKTRDGREHPCDLCGIAVGVEPNIGLARQSGLPTGRGILCDWKLKTSREDVFTAGDCVEIENGTGEDNFVRTIWYSARDMGIAAGRNMLGDDEDYDPGPWYNSAKFIELEFTSCGRIFPRKDGEKNYIFVDRDHEQSVRVVHNEEQVLGFSMIGTRWDHSVLLRFIEESRDLEYFLEHYREAFFDPELFPVPPVREKVKEAAGG